MKILTIVGGGILLAVGIVAGAQVLQLQQAVTIDFDRDICISSSSDKLPTENVHGYLDPNVPIEKPHWGEQEAQYWTELSRKISITQFAASDTALYICDRRIVPDEFAPLSRYGKLRDL